VTPPLWVSIEGVEGVGKTYLAPRLAAWLGARCTLVNEVTDTAPTELVGKVIEALSSDGDLFLRTGHPLTETFALLAVKAYERERHGEIAASFVLEDRGFDSVAIYQAIILAGDDATEEVTLARRIQAVAEHWHRPPDLTLLVVDDIDRCLQRFSSRIGRALRPDEVDLVVQADRLYTRFARAEPDRFEVIDRRGHDDVETVEQMHDACLSHFGARNA
jgi:dTMP kinase